MARGPMKARVVCENGRPPSLAELTTRRAMVGTLRVHSRAKGGLPPEALELRRTAHRRSHRSTRELWWAPFACIPERKVACHPKLSSCVEQPTVARTDLLASYGGHPSRAFQSEGWSGKRDSNPR